MPEMDGFTLYEQMHALDPQAQGMLYDGRRRL